MAAQHFFVGRAHLGTRTIPDNRVVPGLEVRRHFSYAFFCMRCGDIWARLLHDGAVLTQCVVRPCEKHGDGHLADPDSWTDSCCLLAPDWPEAVLKREFGVADALFQSGDRSASPGVQLN